MPKFRVKVSYAVVEQVTIAVDNLTDAEAMCFTLAREQGQEWEEVERNELRISAKEIDAAAE